MRRVAEALLLMAASMSADIHVTTSDALAAAENKPPPEYNPLARQMRIVGDVSVEVQISSTGTVDTVKVLTGNAILSAPVIKTVKTWRFKPFAQNGRPTTAIAVLRFSFK